MINKIFALLVCGLLLAPPVLAREITGIRTAPEQVRPGQQVEIILDVDSHGSFRCGAQLILGDGQTKNLLITEKEAPYRFTYNYSSAGNYVVSVKGEFLVRGLNSVWACNVSAKPIEILVKEESTAASNVSTNAAPPSMPASAVPESQPMQTSKETQTDAAGAGSDCDTWSDEATRGIVQQCVRSAFCSRVMFTQETCPELQAFIGNLSRLAAGKKGIDGSDVFDALAPEIKADDTDAYNAAQAIRARFGKQSRMKVIQEYDFDGRTWVYEGGDIKGKRHGVGVMLSDDGVMFRGEFVKGKQSGQGDRFDGSGTRSIGNMHNLKMSGRGSTRYADGKRYDGSFDNDKRSGKGLLVQPDGYRYEGDWDEGKITGMGKMQHTDGAVYEGEVVSGMREGMGEIHTKDGERYVGQWKGGFRQGQGEQTWSNGDKYKGSWKNNKLNGPGIYTWADGTRDEGEFKDGKMFNGIKTKPNGSKERVRNGQSVEALVEKIKAQYDQKIRAARDECDSIKEGCDTGCAAVSLLGVLAQDQNTSNGYSECNSNCNSKKNRCLQGIPDLEREKSQAIANAQN